MSNMPPDFNTYNPNQFSPPPQKSNKTLWIILGIIFGLLLLCCGGIAIFGYFGAQAVSKVMNEGMKEVVKTSPEAQAELGEIESVSFNFSETQKQGKGVLDVKGSKGTGQVIMQNTDPNGTPSDAVLKLPDGREIPMTFPEMDEPEVDMPELSTEEDASAEVEPANP